LKRLSTVKFKQNIYFVYAPKKQRFIGNFFLLAFFVDGNWPYRPEDRRPVLTLASLAFMANLPTK